uniref:Trypsin Inhibitor like cysteine rich domain protein n=1 Tax=Heterorhabditis bacteriophora TaxID=37862 RepID=A0A1I7X5I6_HETBA
MLLETYFSDFSTTQFISICDKCKRVVTDDMISVFPIFALTTSDYYENIPRCAEVRVKCMAGHHCEDTSSGISCAPDPTCKANEEFQLLSLSCEPTCDNKNPPCDDSYGPPACQCKKGFVRKNGQCVNPNRCRKVNPTDIIKRPTLKEENPCATLKCGSNFYCEIIDGTGQCVPNPGPCASVRCGFNTTCFEFEGSAGCYSTNCGINEEFRSCSSHCEPTCGREDIFCIQSCGVPQCQCKPGYFRKNGKCVSATECGTSSNRPKSTTRNYVDELITPPPLNCSTALILCDKDHHCEDLNGKPNCVKNEGSSKRIGSRSRQGR